MIVNLNHNARVVRELDARAVGREVAARAGRPPTEYVCGIEAGTSETGVAGPGVFGVERHRSACGISVRNDVMNYFRIARLDAHGADPSVAAQRRCGNAEASV